MEYKYKVNTILLLQMGEKKKNQFELKAFRHPTVK